jgi:predicted phosphodiesterase
VTVKVVLSDMQIPYHDKRAVRNVLAFVKATKPDELLCVGDEIDSPQPSRWNKGVAGEYEATLQRDVDLTRETMAAFRKALRPGAPFIVHRSNHGDRVETYIRRYAPALASLRALKIEDLLGYTELDIEFRRQPGPVAPGWLMMHGDESGLNRSPGGTALGLARKTGQSVVCGHTHRLGIQPETVGVNGKTRTVIGFEVGNLMDMRQAHYLGYGASNWQTGFGLLYVDGRNVTPVAVPIHADGSFTVEGKVWGR